MKSNEIWKAIKGFEDRYMISNHGRVKSLSHYMDTSKANARKTIMPEVIMRDRVGKSGYHKITLWNGVKRFDYLVHRLVAEAFVTNPDNKPFIDHLDGNKSNNNYWNLEWVTMAENNQRAYDTGLKRRIHAGQFIKGAYMARML